MSQTPLPEQKWIASVEEPVSLAQHLHASKKAADVRQDSGTSRHWVGREIVPRNMAHAWTVFIKHATVRIMAEEPAISRDNIHDVVATMTMPQTQGNLMACEIFVHFQRSVSHYVIHDRISRLKPIVLKKRKIVQKEKTPRRGVNWSKNITLSNDISDHGRTSTI